MSLNTDNVMELYRTTVRNLLSGENPGIVRNSSRMHASIILEELANCAKKTFHAYCGKFSVDVWTPEVTNRLRQATDRGVDVSIILEEAPESTIPEFLKSKIRYLDLTDVAENKADFDNVNHFASVDGKSVRLENDKRSRTVLFAANHPDVALEIEKIFNILSEHAKAA